MTVDATKKYELPAAELRRSADLSGIDFERSDELTAGGKKPGHERAIDAIDFGVNVSRDGYNVVVIGPSGSDRHALARQLAVARASDRPVPPDWCYVNNFADPERPRALSFPPGRGSVFRRDMRDLIEELRIAIPAAFESDDYRNQQRSIEAETQKEVEHSLKALEAHAAEEGIGVLPSPTGYVLAPVREGEVMDQDEFAKLPEDERAAIQAAIERVSKELQSHFEQMPQMQKRHRERLKALNRKVTDQSVGALLSDLKNKYTTMPEVVAYLDDVEQNIAENAQDFRESERSPLPFLDRDSTRLFSQYDVNLVVDNGESAAAPVVYETNPSYFNVIGTVEHRAEMGALVTDFSMVRAGALHRANGGYLILDIQRLLSRPFVWDALKQALIAGNIRIESPGENLGFASTVTLRPDLVPLDVKLILIGERWHYHLLCRLDSEFNELFKVVADLDDDLKYSEANIEAYARLIAERIRANGMLPFDRGAVQRVIEERARIAADKERLSMHMRSLDDLLIQSEHWAVSRNSPQVELCDVIEALEQRERRHDRTQSRIVDAIDRDMLLVDTGGAKVGQVNGLSVVDLGNHRFGYPVRITATTRIGAGEVVDIEREVELGGAIHSKGMLILSAALRARYALDVPLSLHGSVVFEQSYGGVDGDSASVAELCALLSSIANIPLLQSYAVTGSINQHGRVQVIGGVNEKIEGFHRVCRSRGLDGSHGVLIPAENAVNLMLNDDVIDSVEKGLFRIVAVRDIDQALTVLTGVEAGQRDSSGVFPEGSVNRKVEDQLVRYADLRKNFGGRAREDAN